MLLKVYSGRLALADGELPASVIWTFPAPLAESSRPLRTRPRTGYPLQHPDIKCKLGPKFGIRQKRCIFTAADHYWCWRHHRSLKSLLICISVSVLPQLKSGFTQPWVPEFAGCSEGTVSRGCSGSRGDQCAALARGEELRMLSPEGSDN